METTRDTFIMAWESSRNTKEVAAKMGWSVPKCTDYATKVRRWQRDKGMDETLVLKRMDGSKPGSRGMSIKELEDAVRKVRQAFDEMQNDAVKEANENRIIGVVKQVGPDGEESFGVLTQGERGEEKEEGKQDVREEVSTLRQVDEATHVAS